MFLFFFSTFIALLSFAFALQAMYIAGGLNMTFPWFFWLFIALALIFGLMAVITGIRMLRTPKVVSINQPEINTKNADGIKADLANMNTEQIEAFNNYVNYLKKKLDTDNHKKI
jgi:hypothetical protein